VTISRDGIIKVVRYFASHRALLKSFDILYNHLLSVLAENGKAVRTKAMKALTIVVEADPGLLGDVRIHFIQPNSVDIT
jgi:cohesin loading factor subunit SCC2